MTDFPIRNPSFDFSTKRRAEEVAVDDESKSPKRQKRPRKEFDKKKRPSKEFDKHTAGIVESPTVYGGSPFALQNKDDVSGAKKYGDVKEVSTPKEESDSSSEELFYAIHCRHGCCKEDVDDEVCKLNSSPSTGESSDSDA